MKNTKKVLSVLLSLAMVLTAIPLIGMTGVLKASAVNYDKVYSTEYYYPSGTKTTTIGAFRAYFKIGPDDAPAANARQLTAFNLTFSDGSEQTGIREIVTDPTPNPSPAWEGSAAWYTLDGRKVDGQPTKKGLYIVNGRKVLVRDKR